MPVDPAPPPFDLLTDLMEQVRLEGTVYFHVELHAPWGLEIAREGRSPFYFVSQGRAELRVRGLRGVRVIEAGDFVLLPRGAAHTVRSGPDALLVGFDDFLATHPMDARGQVRLGGRGPATLVTGGFFSCDALRANPLFAALPELIHLKGGSPEMQEWLAPTLAFIEAERAHPAQGGRTVLRRLADVLFIQAVRAVLAQSRTDTSGWLRGLSDARVARALALLHEGYQQPWTLDSLARASGISRTLLAVRFRELVGEPPMRYLERWRTTRAASLLRETRLPVGLVGAEVGYGSEAVFAKAFKRVHGVPPGRYRRHA
jgi:AraC-like DNA-binding protein